MRRVGEGEVVLWCGTKRRYSNKVSKISSAVRNKAHSNTASSCCMEQSVFLIPVQHIAAVWNKAYSNTVSLFLLCGTKRIQIQQVAAVWNKVYSKIASFSAV